MIKIGDLVQLNNKAREEYYETYRHVDAFIRPQNEDMTSEDFVQFCHDWLGFESGDGVGMVDKINSSGDLGVLFYSPLDGSEHLVYYENQHLLKW